MDFLKKHYEKAVLGLVLLALAVVAVLIFVEVGTFKANLDEQLKTRTAVKKKELVSIDLSSNQAVMKRLGSAIQVPLGADPPTYTATFTAPRWRKLANNEYAPDLSKLNQGPAAISNVVTKPLFLTIEYGQAGGTPEAPRYSFVIGREFEKQANKRGNLTLSATVGQAIRLPGQKSDLFRLLEVKGPPTEPTELIIQLTAENERATIGPKRPYRQVMGYSADFVYGVDRRAYRNIRVDDSLSLSGTSYKVVSVSDNDLVISAPNQIRTTIRAAVTP